MHHDCHMVFRGHLHLQQIRAILYPDDVCLELAAGSCYDGSEYPNTFQLVELDRQGETPRVHFWLWTGIEWVEDRNAYAEAADGVACFSWGVYRRKPGIEEQSRLPEGFVPSQMGRTFPPLHLRQLLDSSRVTE